MKGVQEAVSDNALRDKVVILAEVYAHFVAAYWTALVIALWAALRAFGFRKFVNAAQIGLLFLAGLAWLIACVAFVDAIVTGSFGVNFASFYDWFAFGLVWTVLLAPAHIIWARRNNVPSELALPWPTAIVLFLWFTFWGIAFTPTGGGLIGLWCSWAMSACLLFSITAEAAAIAKVSWRQGFRQLLLCKLHAPLKGYCEHCGYDLRGLPEPRCPECGTPFSPAV